MNAYPKLHTQLPNSWSIITESTDKPCECLYWHCTACSLVYNSFKSCRAYITTQPWETDIPNQSFQWNTSDHNLIRNLSRQTLNSAFKLSSDYHQTFQSVLIGRYCILTSLINKAIFGHCEIIASADNHPYLIYNVSFAGKRKIIIP